MNIYLIYQKSDDGSIGDILGAYADEHMAQRVVNAFNKVKPWYETEYAVQKTTLSFKGFQGHG